MTTTAKRLSEFSTEVRRLVGDAVGLRPFLCDGDPYGCTVAVVGANPGTTTPFWPFWSDERGLDKAGWLRSYREQHDGKYGRSRAAIERLLPQVNAKVIELNAHAKQSDRLAQLGREHRTTDVLGFVMATVKPVVSVCAGADAYRAVSALSVDWPMEVIEVKHFIYWGRDMERELAARVNGLLPSSRKSA